jgi:hypothetical protein
MFGGNQKVDMIGHQAVSMDSNAIALGINFPEIEIALVVLWLDKTGFAIIAALNDMVRIPGKVHPCTPRHCSSFAIYN